MKLFRTIPKPNLPPTSNAKLAGNYYYTRDQRRKAGPPTIVSSALQSTAPQLEAGSRYVAFALLLLGFLRFASSVREIEN